MDAAGGLKAFLPVRPVLWAGFFFILNGFVADCGNITKVVHVGQVLFRLTHAPAPLLVVAVYEVVPVKCY